MAPCSHCRFLPGGRPLHQDGQRAAELNIGRSCAILADLMMALLARCGRADPFFPLTEQLFTNQKDFFAKAQASTPSTESAVKQPRAALRPRR
jgi:hypothetical protein